MEDDEELISSFESERGREAIHTREYKSSTQTNQVKEKAFTSLIIEGGEFNLL